MTAPECVNRLSDCLEAQRLYELLATANGNSPRPLTPLERTTREVGRPAMKNLYVIRHT